MARKKDALPSDDHKIADAFEAMAEWPDGLIVLRAIFKLCRYDQSATTVNPQTGELNIQATIYNQSKRDVWLMARRYLSAKTLAKIENQED